MGGEDPQGGKFQIGQDMVPHFLDDTETMRGSGHWGCVFTWFKLWDDWLILFCPAGMKHRFRLYSRGFPRDHQENPGNQDGIW